MLYKEVSTSDLSIEVLLIRYTVLAQICCVVLAHVVLERVAVGFLRRLPSRLLGVWVEVVWEVLAVGVSDLLRNCVRKPRGLNLWD